jgi:T-complex protein 1 subunit alpha
LAVAEYAQALLTIPKTLAVNGAHDASELTAQLRAYHNAAQTDLTKAEFKHMGLDLQKGKVRSSVKAGVLEPAISKIKSLKSATEAAIAILRIDDRIKLNPRDDPKYADGH